MWTLLDVPQIASLLSLEDKSWFGIAEILGIELLLNHFCAEISSSFQSRFLEVASLPAFWAGHFAILCCVDAYIASTTVKA